MSARDSPGAWRRVVRAYARLLDHLLVASVALIILPVSLQIFARFTDLLPRYIWTEELARFLLVWMVMIGAMVGVREASHFTVDLFPSLAGRARAAMDLLAGAFVALFGGIFLWYGIEFTDFAWFRISELAELPLWLIHIAWPVSGAVWLFFLAGPIAANVRTLVTGRA